MLVNCCVSTHRVLWIKKTWQFTSIAWAQLSEVLALNAFEKDIVPHLLQEENVLPELEDAITHRALQYGAHLRNSVSTRARLMLSMYE